MTRAYASVMIVSALVGGISLGVGLYSLTNPSQAVALMGRIHTISPLISWTNILVGVFLLAMVSLTAVTRFSKLMGWNGFGMLLFGVVMVVVGVLLPRSPSILMGTMAAVMLTSGIGLTFGPQLFGTVSSCPTCGSEVVSWGRRGITYCTKCPWYFGAIPRSASLIVTGDSGIGKTMLMLKLAEVFRARGRRIVYVACDQPPSSVRNIQDGIQGGQEAAPSGPNPDFEVVDAFSSSGGLQSEERHHTNHVFDLSELNRILIGLGKRGDLMVIVDSVNPLFLNNDEPSVLRFLYECKARLTGKGEVFVFSLNDGTIETSVLKTLESMVDIVVEMKFAEGAQGRVRRFRFTKIRGRDVFDDWVYFDVHPKLGLVFRPIEKSPRDLGVLRWIRGPV